MDGSTLTQACILIVDDEESNVALIQRVLELNDFENVVTTTDSTQALPLCLKHEPDIVLLDRNMPELDGFGVLEQLQPWIQGTPRLPVVMLTADHSAETKKRALSVGASDFLNKPFNLTEVVLRIRNLLTTRFLQAALRDQNKMLERRVRERTRDLEEARLEIIDRLALAAEYRDDATGEHTRRVGRTSALLARALGLDEGFVELIGRAAPLHDVGKLGISDEILLKQGKLTPVEFEVMKLHVSIGAEILGRSRSELLQLSEEIARTHHERWDGAGYLAALRGEAIPNSGRIVALADVFDALTHKRPYKEAWTVDRAVEEIRRLSGQQFDPQVVDAFLALDHEELLSRAPELELVA